MFERATAFSAVVFFILFCIAGHKYIKFMEAKNPDSPTSITSSPAI